MLFTHKTFSDKKIFLSYVSKAVASKALSVPIFKELWNNFTFKTTKLDIIETDDIVFKIGNIEDPTLNGEDYAISVSEEGICISANTERNLICGFMTLLDMFQMDEEGNVTAPICEIKESARIKMRAIHFCVFHSTELWELERFIRFCGVLKYTHIILEFWGMLKYDCLPELAWSDGYTKEEIRPLIDLAVNLGMEIIPMFNHWGHAPSARVNQGKHVVLNQNPSLQYYYDDTGWSWNIKSQRTRDLMSDIRRELIELCGNGEYFHIGCDEAGGFVYTNENIASVCNYINEVASDLAGYGRKTLIWGDMLLSRDVVYKHGGYIRNCPNRECQEHMLDGLDKSIIIADWQYDVKSFPVETSLMLKDKGFDVVVCSWDEHRESIPVIADTVIENGLLGFMHTTWHTLTRGTPYISDVAVRCWNEDGEYSGSGYFKEYAAAILRRCYDTSSYERAGFAKEEVPLINY